jgi:hypothetical protein
VLVLEPWRYVVAMKSLPSEYRALRTLAPEVRSLITPLVQLWDRQPTETVEEEGEGGPEEWIQEPGLFDQSVAWEDLSADRIWKRLREGLFPKTMSQWPVEQPLLADGEWLEDAESFRTVIERARALGMRVTPVTGLDRTREYQSAVATVTSAERGGVTIRLRPADFLRGEVHVAQELLRLVGALGGMPQTTDLLIDLKSISHAARELEERNVEAVIGMLPTLGHWRNLGLLASGAPRRVDATEFPLDDATPYSRPEWWVWLQLRERAVRLGRLPVYGDYATMHPDPIESIGKGVIFQRIPQLRYAFGDSILMTRGHDLRRDSDGTSQIRKLLHRIDEYGAWRGPDFSAGDEWLAEAALGRRSPGLWGTWKWAGQVHYLTHVIRQLANLGEL